MKESPILFSAPMVSAILRKCDPKTQTRRAVKPQKLSGSHDIAHIISTPDSLSAFVRHFCPYGAPGDRLWVRETHSIQSVEGCRAWLTFKERMPLGKTLADTDAGLDEFELTPEQAEWALRHRDSERWRPSIFMPRWASRITLEITEVRVERLRDISAHDCWAEGIPCSPDVNPLHEYEELWNKLNAKRGFGWDANPWVWAISFRRIAP